ncbi:hypothetical protein DM47_1910 [Burkholderia mallei]|nr:hypothetical protein DM75_2550 [Burkholderia mallei]KOS92132.1 hypothetical protein DM45_2610 [Burkholderia mallei]KOS92517.1 hypothetical protein DM49_2724 [Burkholderia mallei]KOT07844.1 hypothetical protein DM77_2019 [Burkholderia mallei]KOT18649.1 hypothetical protein DM47_1910 [Burkholderia mallei]
MSRRAAVRAGHPAFVPMRRPWASAGTCRRVIGGYRPSPAPGGGIRRAGQDWKRDRARAAAHARAALFHATHGARRTTRG